MPWALNAYEIMPPLKQQLLSWKTLPTGQLLIVTGDTLLLSCTELINGTLHWLLLRDRI